MNNYYVYILASKSNGNLYIGVSNIFIKKSDWFYDIRGTDELLTPDFNILNYNNE